MPGGTPPPAPTGGQAGGGRFSHDSAAQAFIRAHSHSHAEMWRRARVAQRDTLSTAAQHELGLDSQPSLPGIRRNSSAPSLSRPDDGLPKIVIGICGAYMPKGLQPQPRA